MAQITNFERETFLIHALELKLWLFEVCIGSHSLATFGKKIFTGTRDKFYGRAGYVDDPLPYIVHIAVCIVWLYYASSSTVWWFSDHFFFLLSVWSPCKKKIMNLIKKFLTTIICKLRFAPSQH